MRASPAPHSPRAAQPGRAGVSFPPELGAGPGWGCSCSRHGAGRGPARRPPVRACAAAGGRALGLHAARRARARRAPHRLQGRHRWHSPAWAPRHPPARGLPPVVGRGRWEDTRGAAASGCGEPRPQGLVFRRGGTGAATRTHDPRDPLLRAAGKSESEKGGGTARPGGRKKFLWHIRWAGVGGGPHIPLHVFAGPVTRAVAGGDQSSVCPSLVPRPWALQAPGWAGTFRTTVGGPESVPSCPGTPGTQGKTVPGTGLAPGCDAERSSASAESECGG